MVRDSQTLRIATAGMPCQQNGRCAVAASDICNAGAAFELFLDAFQCRDPFRQQMRAIARAEKSLRAAKQTGVVLMPSDPVASAERRLDLGEIARAAAAISNIVGKKPGPFSSARTTACWVKSKIAPSRNRN